MSSMWCNLLILILITLKISEIVGKRSENEGENYDISEMFNMFGSRSRLDPRLEDKYKWVPSCNDSMFDWIALNTISRAQTETCKRELTEVACMSANNILVPEHIPSSCPQFKQNLDLVGKGGQHLGCFKDREGYWPDYRTLPDFVRRPIGFLTRDYCVRQCSQAGYPYAGLEGGFECWCGLTPPNPPNLDIEECSMPCTGGVGNCGGILTISVYYTGVEINRQIPVEDSVNQTRIVFFLSVFGRDVRQIRRLLKVIYKPHHYYYIHVDTNSPWLLDQLKNVATPENVKFASKRFNTFWGSNTQLYMMLVSYKEMLEIEGWHFDFVMRISESDFPVKPVEEFAEYLSTRIGQNFIESYRSYNGGGAIQVSDIYYNCEGFMYRLSSKSQLPWGLQWNSASDWFTISKSFMNYLVYSEDLLVRNLLNFFQYKISSSESFFLTALHNSRFCQTRADEHLHAINHVQSCSCGRNMDACGCSPHYLTNKDQTWIRTVLREPTKFFARKFSAVVGLDVVNQLEQVVCGSSCSVYEGSGWNSHWLNSYNSQQDVKGDSRHLLARVSSLLVGMKPLEITSYFRDNKYQGELVLYRKSSGKQESFIKPDYKIKLWSNEVRNVTDIQISTDSKYGYGNYSSSAPLLILPSSNLSLVVQFGSPSSGVPFYSIKFQIYNKTGAVIGEKVNLVTNQQGQHIININYFFSGQPTEYDPNIHLSVSRFGNQWPDDRLPQYNKLTPGVYSVSISHMDHMLATLSFLVIGKDQLQSEERVSDNLVKTFYKQIDKCQIEPRGEDLKICSETFWSSLSPDLKTAFI